MKQRSMLTRGLFLFFMAMSIFSNAQYINEQDQESKYYLPSQSVSSHYWIWTAGMWEINGKKDIENNLKNNIKSKSVQNYKVKKKGERLIEKYRAEQNFDKKGRLIEDMRFRRGREKNHFLLKYNSDGFFTQYIKYVRGTFKKKEVLVYNEDNNVLEYRRYSKKGLQRKLIAEYNDTLLTNQWSYKIKKNDSTEILNKWEYEYYPSNEKKQTKYYRNGKLKHTWLYTCDEEGEEIKSNDETKVCEIKQYNNDSTYVVIKRNTGKKGKITKRRYTYDKADRLLMQEYINVKGKITSKWSYKYDDNGKKLAWYNYRRGKNSDKVRYGIEYVYNTDGKIIENRQIGKKGMYGKTVYTFDSKGNKISSEYIDSKKGKEFSYTYKYNDKNLLIETNRFNKKNILINQYNTKYQYN